MKNFALKLEGCSKADRKKVIKLAKSVGIEFGDDDRFKDGSFGFIKFRNRNLVYTETNSQLKTVYQMPRDWNKIQEALGVEVPKDGEIVKVLVRDGRWMIIRIKSKPEFSERNKCHSMIDLGRDFDVNCEYGFTPIDTSSKATPEEEAKLIEAEHANGYHWDGNNLVKIPEYVEFKGSCLSCYTKGCIYKVCDVPLSNIYNTMLHAIDDFGNENAFGYRHFRPSTKEAFESQEAKMQIDHKDYIKRTDLLVENSELKQTIKTLSHTADILAQENAELIKKLYKIKGIL